MSEYIPRMRMFAGPNGSGKSTIIDAFKDAYGHALLGTYINADEILKQIQEYEFLDFRAFSITTTQDEWCTFAVTYTRSFKPELLGSLDFLMLENDKLFFNEVNPNSYYASVIASFIREKLFEEKKDFTFETVMSHKGKVEFLEKLQNNGFRTYLYFVATDDPDINVSRVNARVASGGHFVPEDKIRKRYTKSLNMLKEALKFSNRAYIYDNSGNESALLAEYSQDDGWKIKVNEVPLWFANAVPSLRQTQKRVSPVIVIFIVIFILLVIIGTSMNLHF